MFHPQHVDYPLPPNVFATTRLYRVFARGAEFNISGRTSCRCLRRNEYTPDWEENCNYSSKFLHTLLLSSIARGMYKRATIA